VRWRVIYDVVAGFHAREAQKLNEATSIDPSRVETIDKAQFHPDISMYQHRRVVYRSAQWTCNQSSFLL